MFHKLRSVLRSEKAASTADAAGHEIKKAIRDNNVQKVRQLVDRVDHVSDLDLPDQLGFTLLMTAVILSDPRIVRILLETGCAVNAKNYRGQTALHLAASSARADVVTLLLQFEADADIADHVGQTPVMLATAFEDEAQSLPAVNALLSFGSGTAGTNPLGDSPLTMAAFLGHSRKVELLLRCGAERDAHNNYGLTATELAKSGQHAEVIRLLQRL